jgi:hypothetical protein
VEVVVLAVFLLGGDRRSVDTEDVAVKAHELAPQRFAWTKYPNQINLELVRVYLSDAKKKRETGAGWLAGSGRTGWTLTPRGLDWVRKEQHRLLGDKLARARKDIRSGSVEEQRWRRERARIESTPAWGRWTGGERDVPVREAAEVFRIDSYAVGRMRGMKITRFLSLLGDDAEVGPFLRRMAEIVETGEE